MQSSVEASRPFSARLLAENLKALNAKERDHLMRLAYLGQEDPYDGGIKLWLSPRMEDLLRAKAGVPAAAACVFAGMDYHLDWVFAALKFSCEGIRVAEVQKAEQFPCNGCQEDTHPTGDATTLTEQADLLPVSGRQEDVDLLVLFADGGKGWLLFIEAKGAASFDSQQLARKVIRLDRILGRSGAKALGEDRLECELVLVAPEQPKESSAFEIASACKGLADLLREQHTGGIGKPPLRFIPLAGFPKSLVKVKRIPIHGQPGTYTNWKVAKR